MYVFSRRVYVKNLLFRKNRGWWKIPSRVWLFKASPNSHLRQSRIHLQQTTHKVVVIQQTLHGWRLAKHGNSQQKIASKKVDHEGPTTTKKVWKIWILPFQVRYQSFFWALASEISCKPCAVLQHLLKNIRILQNMSPEWTHFTGRRVKTSYGRCLSHYWCFIPKIAFQVSGF